MNRKKRSPHAGLALMAMVTATPVSAADLNVTLTTGGSSGKIWLGLCRDAASFDHMNDDLTDRSPPQPLEIRTLVPENGIARTSFTGLPPGRYALSAFQDVNGNGELDENLLGVPTEPYGFSGNVRGKLAPPSFDDAAITLSGGMPLTITIILKSGL